MNQRILFSGIALIGWALGVEAVATAPGTIPAPDLAAARQRMAALTVPFVPNAGQWDQQAAFGAQTLAGMLFVTADGALVYALPGIPAEALGKSSPHRNRNSSAGNAASARGAGWVLREEMTAADLRPIAITPTGISPQSGKVSYFVGEEKGHRNAVPTFERVDLGEAYPGIGVQLRATGNNVEKIFTVAPGRDPAQIRVRVTGAERMDLSAQGALVVTTGNGPVTYTAPLAYQENSDGSRHEVQVQYVLDSGARSYGFRVAEYDHSSALIIDPLLQSTYLGGPGTEFGGYIAIHPLTGDVYVTGCSDSAVSTFPGVTGGAQPVFGGGAFDGYVSRLNAGLTTLIQSTYIGAAGNDCGRAIAIHPVSGDVYIAGTTDSPGSTFPGVSGGAQVTSGGGTDGFVSRFNAGLTVLFRSTYLGAAGTDFPTAIAIHPTNGVLYVAGYTDSPGATFPGVGSGAQTSYGGSTNDAFVSRLTIDLTSLEVSTYLGAAGNDQALAMAIHPFNGDVYVAGQTSSLGSTFPGVGGGAQPASGGGINAFVTRLNQKLSVFVQSTYLGGSDFQLGHLLAIHPASGDVYVGGHYVGGTPGGTLPGATGGAQSVPGGAFDAFVSRLNAALTNLIQSTYLGAAGADVPHGLVIHPVTGDVYVTGVTESPGNTFPAVTGGFQSVHGGGSQDAFVSRFSTDLTALWQSAYLGTDGMDGAFGLAIHPATGEVYVGGQTSGGVVAFPGSPGGAQPISHGGYDIFISRSSPDLMAADVLPDPFSFPARLNVPVGSAQTSAPALITGISIPVQISLAPGSFAEFCISSGNDCSCDAAAFTPGPGIISNNQHVCVRQVAPGRVPAAAVATLIVGGGHADFLVTTAIGGAATSCSLDTDGNGAQDALSDGLIILRAMFGLTGTSVTNGALSAGATRLNWASLRAYLNGNCGSTFAP